MIATFMNENIQETSFCFLSLVPVIDNLSKMFLGKFCFLNMKKSTHKK